MTEPEAHTFSKSERLVSTKQIETLFGGGHSHSASVFPVRAVYMQTSETASGEPPVQVLVSVSKRHFKRAVKRNRVKRQIREAYRQNKYIVTDAATKKGCRLYVAFIWQADHLCPTNEVAKSVKTLLQRMSERL